MRCADTGRSLRSTVEGGRVMDARTQAVGRWNRPAAILVGVLVGAGLFVPAQAHVPHKKHFDKRYVNETQTAGGDLTGTFSSLAVGANAVGAAEIADGGVDGAEIADGAVGSGELADGSVGPADIAGEAVETGHLAPGSVTPAKVATIPAVRATSPSETFNNDQILQPGEEAIVFDEEAYDTASMHTRFVPVDGTGSRFVAPIAGVYHIDAGLIFSNPAAGGEGTFRQLALKKNGSTQTIDVIAGVQLVPDPDGEVLNVSGTVFLNPGDYVELYAAHDAGGNIVTPQSQFGLVGDGRHFFTMTWLGP
jgi:hypothetical protein